MSEEVEQAVDDAGDLVGVAVVARSGHDLGQPLAGRRRAVVGAETARAADGFGDGPPHVGAVRDALAAEHLGVVGLARVGRDLTGEAALADPGVAREDDEVRAATQDGAVGDAAQEAHLGVAADERGPGVTAALARRGHGLDGPPRVDGLLPTLHGDRAAVVVADGVAGGFVGVRPDEDLVGLGRGLQAVRGVHGVAQCGVVAAGPEPTDDDLSRVDPDAQMGVDRLVVAEPGQGLLHAQRRPDGPFRIVFVGHRRAEQGDHGVAHDLVDPAAERGDVVAQLGEALVDERLDLLGIGRLGERREPDEVGEQDRGDPALVLGVDQRVPTGGAEAGAGLVRFAARGAVHGRQPTDPADPGASAFGVPSVAFGRRVAARLGGPATGRGQWGRAQAHR